jgi:hypothetical protein
MAVFQDTRVPGPVDFSFSSPYCYWFSTVEIQEFDVRWLRPRSGPEGAYE